MLPLWRVGQLNHDWYCRRISLCEFHPDGRCLRYGERLQEIEEHLKFSHLPPAPQGRQSRSPPPRRLISPNRARPIFKPAGVRGASPLPAKLRTATFGDEATATRPDEYPLMPLPHDVPLTPSFETAKRTSAAITISVDCCPVTALVDTGADPSVMSASLATELREGLTTWDGPQLVTAGVHHVSPIGRCTTRLDICASAFVASFLVPPKYPRPVTPGMDFLPEYGAVINPCYLFVTFANCASTDSDVEDEHCRVALRVVDDCVTLPPLSSVFVLVESPRDQSGTGIAEGNVPIAGSRSHHRSRYRRAPKWADYDLSYQFQWRIQAFCEAHHPHHQLVQCLKRHWTS